MTELRDVLDSMEARHIALPLSEALVCTFDDAVGPLVSLMERRQFDCCPVLEGGVPVGVFDRLLRASSVELGTRPLIVGQLISADTRILELARKLDEHDFVFVLSGSRISGFITVADLGSTLARSFCYLQLASVEMGLSKYLRSRFPDQPLAIELLGESRQKAHLSLVDRLKKEDQYIDDFAACSLEDLLRIVGKDQVFRQALTDNRGWQNLKSGLIDFRNDVMHPSRPLVAPGVRSVSKFVEKIENLQIIAHAVDRILREPDAEL
ncbi:hypothetical protein [Arthrobacter sp. SLBN-112]|uniref:hypothetical protein n=1 Tax=Arthrobacter sp. SLBN-112 TaxID=2768452 RepID=UPI0027B82153|nr:hypothetical protein [Arthrobacter sp. SLBN-112]MDQ0802164.1 CBS domain-containing protein [Arthrobacter sp. SLBN-112]